ncbi:MAG: molybdenum cofactor guanylyltransferase, partial [Deferrisomatales bacterium]
MRDIRTALLLADGRDDRWSWELQGEALIHRTHRILEGFFDQIVVVAEDPAPFAALGFRAVADDYPGAALLGAITTGLKHVQSRYAFVVGAD